MKQFLLTCAFAAVSVAATAQTTDVSPVLGRYAGDLYIALSEEVYDDEAKMDANVYLNESETAGCVNFSLPNFSFSGMPLGDINLPNISLTQNNGSYTFGKNPTVSFNFLDGSILADAHLDEARSYVKGDSLVAYVPVIWTNEDNTPIYVLFKGKLANVFQLDNSTFDESTWTQNKPWDSLHGYLDWDDISTSAVSEDARAAYVTPSPWCVSNVIGIKGLGATRVAEPLDINAVEGTDTEADDYVSNYAVALTNTPNPYMPSNTVPGYVTLGTSWATAVSALSPKNADGGTFGGVAFTGKPDAVKFKYIHINEEVDSKYSKTAVINKEEPATVVAYLWKGVYKQEEVPGNTAPSNGIKKVTMYGRDRNILGLETAEGGATTTSDDAACIAKVIESITDISTSATPSEMIVPLDYGKYAGTDVTPDSLNIIFAANDYFGDRSKIGAGNTLIIDDVELLYYHGIANVKQGNTAINFDADYNAVCKDLKYDANTFTYTKIGEGATVTENYDDATNTLTITVASQQVKYKPEEVTTYTIQFGGNITSIKDATAAPAAAAKAYGLDGRRAATSAHGVLIVNGKKTVK